MSNTEDKRHPSTEHMLKMLKPNPDLPVGTPERIAAWAYESALMLTEDIQDSPELTAGLRKLLEAKDCFVRCVVLDDDPVDYRDR